MFFRVAVILATLALAFTIQTNGRQYDRPVPRGEVDDLLDELKKVVDEYIATAQEALNTAAKQVNDTAEAVQASAEAQMQSTEAKFKEEIDKLKQKAADAGVNIDECLAGNEEKLVNMPNELSNDMIHCVSDRIIEEIGYAQDALNQIQTTVNEIENIKQEIKDCGHGLSSIKCLAKLAIKIEEDIVSLPKKITDDVDSAVTLIEELDDRIEQCASTKVDELETEGEKLLLVISECVAKKIITG